MASRHVEKRHEDRDSVFSDTTLVGTSEDKSASTFNLLENDSHEDQVKEGALDMAASGSRQGKPRTWITAHNPFKKSQEKRQGGNRGTMDERTLDEMRSRPISNRVKEGAIGDEMGWERQWSERNIAAAEESHQGLNHVTGDWERKGYEIRKMREARQGNNGVGGYPESVEYFERMQKEGRHGTPRAMKARPRMTVSEIDLLRRNPNQSHFESLPYYSRHSSLEDHSKETNINNTANLDHVTLKSYKRFVSEWRHLDSNRNDYYQFAQTLHDDLQQVVKGFELMLTTQLNGAPSPGMGEAGRGFDVRVKPSISQDKQTYSDGEHLCMDYRLLTDWKRDEPIEELTFATVILEISERLLADFDFRLQGPVISTIQASQNLIRKFDTCMTEQAKLSKIASLLHRDVRTVIRGMKSLYKQINLDESRVEEDPAHLSTDQETLQMITSMNALTQSLFHLSSEGETTSITVQGTEKETASAKALFECATKLVRALDRRRPELQYRPAENRVRKMAEKASQSQGR